MKPFRATYKPRKYGGDGDFVGYDENKAERVLVIAILNREDSEPWVVFIDEKDHLHYALMDCFTECEWKA